MTLDQMCQSAARYADRYDEFEKTENEDGRMVYEDDALHYFNVFRDAINEAYFEVARNYGRPDAYKLLTVPEDGIVSLADLDPQPYAIKRVLDESREKDIEFRFQTRYELYIPNREGQTVTLLYQYLPDRLTTYGDEPIFPESQVDAMVYISLAVAQIWLSEKKTDLYNTWMNKYYMLLKQVRSSLMSRSRSRIPRRAFR